MVELLNLTFKIMFMQLRIIMLDWFDPTTPLFLICIYICVINYSAIKYRLSANTFAFNKQITL